MMSYRDAWRYNWLVRVSRRVESDRKAALERNDLTGAIRHANRVYVADARLRGYLGDNIEPFRS